MKRRPHHVRLLCALLVTAACHVSQAQVGVEQALRDSRVRGGLCAIVGSVDTEFAARTAKNGAFLVHCLSPDPAEVNAAREALLGMRLYGRVSVEHWQGPGLPYADDLVSVLIVLDPAMGGQAELLRVLRPGGEMIVKQGEKFITATKPRPAGMDDWTHWRHDADRNPVSKDTLVDVPDRVQWLFSSKAFGERAHMVCAGGKAFTQDKDVLTARDAFNGLPLWKAKLKLGADFEWEWTVKVAALIVAKGERVYALMDDGKLKALDAATGEPVRTYEEAGVPYDVLLADDGQSKLGTLVLSGRDAVRALDAESGKLLWKHDANRPHNAIASSYGVFYIEGNDRRGAGVGEISARELLSGKLMWKKSYDWARRTEYGAFGYDRIAYEMRSPTNWREFYAAHPEQKEKDNYALVVISSRTGEEVQKVRGVGTSARHGEFRRAFWYKEHLLTEAYSREGLSLAMFKLDDFTRPAVLFKANYVGDRGFGHCYPPVLTDRYYLNGQLNFTDLRTHKQVSNQITRGACNTAREGYLPANGMVYTFPKHCICFPMLEGNVGLAAAYPNKPPESNELVRGPAWPAAPVEMDCSKEWPMFRHDEYRTGGTDVIVPAELRMLWTSQVPGPGYDALLTSEWPDNPYAGGSITAPVVANGVVYVAQGDTHRLIALDEKTGKEKWHFLANGRIDGPPTIHKGMCLFGCRSGWVYNLRAADGELIWRLRVAPYERRISVYGQVESPWAAPGSVLVVDGLAYVAAGLHPNADGGVRVVCFKPESGQTVWKSKFDDLGFASPWPDPYDPRKTRPDSDPWRTIRPLEYRYFDLPVRDGDSVAVSRCLFDLKTGRIDLRKTSGFYHVKQTGAYMPRTAWRYGANQVQSPVAVCRGASVFSTVPCMSKLFRADFEKAKPFDTDWVRVSEEDDKAGFVHSTGKMFRAGTKWAVDSADNKRSFNRAMLVAGDNLFTITPKGILKINRAEDGKELAEMQLDLPAWEGLAAANGRLYLSTVDGKVICLGGK